MGNFLPAAFAVESPEDADEEFLQRVVRRKLGLPWEICRTGRLIIREFAESDADSIPPGETGGPGDGIFQDREKLQAYIGQQYGFCQYGIWAVTDKESGRLVGMAGFGPPAGDMDGLELGYHIFAPWRRRGYGLESCRAVLEWGAPGDRPAGVGANPSGQHPLPASGRTAGISGLQGGEGDFVPDSEQKRNLKSAKKRKNPPSGACAFQIFGI